MLAHIAQAPLPTLAPLALKPPPTLLLVDAWNGAHRERGLFFHGEPLAFACDTRAQGPSLSDVSALARHLAETFGTPVAQVSIDEIGGIDWIDIELALAQGLIKWDS